MTHFAEYPAYARLDLDVVGAHGNSLLTRDGSEYLDLYGGHCVNSLGAGDAELGKRIAEQWQQLSFVTNLLPHDARNQFEAAMAPGMPPLPGDSWQYFCSNSGAEANENALKLALAATGRDTVVCFTGAFHGRTAAASALNDPPEAAWPRTPFEVRRLAWGETSGIDTSVAAVILEPIQSLAGVIDPPPGFLESLRSACDDAGALLIFDEVQTGNSRLGTPWAAQYFGVTPDLFTTAKGAGGGIPFGLTIGRAATLAATPPGLLGSTFGGGPLALTAAAEVARRVAAQSFSTQLRAVSARLQQAAGLGPVRTVRGAGLLLGLELEAGWTASALRDQLLAQRILTGTCKHPQVLRLSPALTLRLEEADRLLDALAQVGLPA